MKNRIAVLPETLKIFQLCLTWAWMLSERVGFPKESVCQRQNEFKDLAGLSVI